MVKMVLQISYVGDGSFKYNGASHSTITGYEKLASAYIGFGLDFDHELLYVWLDGVLQKTLDISVMLSQYSTLYAMVGAYSRNYEYYQFTCNFGATSFQYPQSGFNTGF